MPEGDDPCAATIGVLREIHEHLWGYANTVNVNPFFIEERAAFSHGVRTGLEFACDAIKHAALQIERHGIQQSLTISAGSSSPGAVSVYDLKTPSPSSGSGTELQSSMAALSDPPTSSGPSAWQSSLPEPPSDPISTTTRPAAERRGPMR